jgi:PST family polysaccharide transporter
MHQGMIRMPSNFHSFLRQKSVNASASPRKRLFANTRALVIMQAANYLIPIALLPYLTRTLGLELFGIYALSLAATQLAFVFTDYGLSLSGTYSISRRRNRPLFVRRFIGAALALKSAILTILVIAIAALIMWQTKYAAFRPYFLLMIVPIIAEAFVPTWIFHGLERISYITRVIILSRAINAVLVFALIRSPSEYLLLPWTLATAHFVAIAIGWRQLFKLGYAPTFPGLRFTTKVVRASTGYFLSRLAVATYTSVGSLFLGFMQSATQVALFSAAQQVYRALQGCVGMMSQALYPYMVRERDFTLLRNAAILATIGGILGVAFVYAFGQELVVIIFGHGFFDAYEILRIFVAAFAVATISIFLGYPLFGAIGRPDLANTSVILGGVAQLALLAAAFFAHKTSATFVAMCILAAEAFVLIIRLYLFYRFFGKSKNG